MAKNQGETESGGERRGREGGERCGKKGEEEWAGESDGGKQQEEVEGEIIEKEGEKLKDKAERLNVCLYTVAGYCRAPWNSNITL